MSSYINLFTSTKDESGKCQVDSCELYDFDDCSIAFADEDYIKMGNKDDNYQLYAKKQSSSSAWSKKFCMKCTYGLVSEVTEVGTI